MYHGMDIDWEKMEEVARTSSARDVLIGNAEDAVVEAAVAWAKLGGAGGAASLEEPLFDAVDQLIALREGQ